MAGNQSREKAQALLDHLERTLQSQVDEGFFADAKAFRSLPRVIEILGENLQMDQDASWTSTITVDYLQQHNVAYQSVLRQLQVVKSTITELVDNQYEDLNAGVENMGHVLSQYTSARSSVKNLRQSLTEVRGLLTKGMTQQRVRDLWMNKLLYKHTIRILDKLEMLTNAPTTISNMIEQKRFVAAVTHLNNTLAEAFSEDLVDVKGGDLAREELVLRKQSVLEEIVKELRTFVFLQGNFNSEFVDVGAPHAHPSTKAASEREDESLSELDSGSVRSSDHASDAMETQTIVSFGGFSTASGGTTRSASDRLSIDTWPDNIHDVTLETELALSIPASAGNVLIRLCVRALMLLNCLDDAERMIVEDARMELAAIMANIRMQFTRAGTFQSDGYEKRFTDGVYKSSDDELRVFNSYFRALMEAYGEVMKRMFYILVLLQSARRGDGESPTERSPRPDVSARQSIFADPSKKAAIAGRAGLRDLRSCLENALLTELRRHIERDVLATADSVMPETTPLSPLARQSLDLDLADEAGNEQSVDYVCPSSPYLAVFVYRPVEKFVAQLDRTCGTTPARGHSDSPLLTYVQNVVADDVMPLVQRDANVMMRTVTQDDDAFLPGSALSSFSSPRGSRSKRVAPNRAAEMTFKTVHELFRYALLVPQHTDQVVLILQRTVEEFATAVRNRKKELTNQLMSQEVCARIHSSSSLSSVLSSDSYYRRYCKRVFDGKPSALEVLGVSNQIRAAAHDMFPEGDAESDEEEERPSYAPNAQNHSSSPTLRAALAASRPHFPPSVWALDAQPYVITRERVALDFKQIGCLASLIYSCDWLAYQLCKACVATQRKTQPGRQRLSTPVNRPTSMFQRTGALWLTVTQCCGQLEKLSAEGVVHMRAELELSCFYFVQQLPQKRFDLSNRQSDHRGVEPEPSVASLNSHLSTCQECICAAAPSELFITTICGACSLLPSLLLYSTSFIKGHVSSDGSARLTRSAMSIQQTLIGALETAAADKQPIAELIQDVNDQFGRLRRFMSMTDLQVDELKRHIQQSKAEFGRDELLVLWRLACRKPDVDTTGRNLDEEFASLLRM